MDKLFRRITDMGEGDVFCVLEVIDVLFAASVTHGVLQLIGGFSENKNKLVLIVPS